VEGFGAVSSVGQLRAAFGEISASILRVQNFISSAIVTVAIPPSDLAGRVGVGMQLLRAGIPVREADKSSFMYYVPAASISAAKWCQTCFEGRTCIMNGRCGDGSTPLEGRTPMSGQGVVTVYVDNLPVLRYDTSTGAPSAGVSITGFGFNSVLRRVSYSSKLQTAMEFSGPRLLAPSEKEYVLRFSDTSADDASLLLPVKLVHFDASIEVTCSPCVAPSQASQVIMVNITNMMVPTTQQAADTLDVTFGALPAPSVFLVSSDARVTSVLVTPPDYMCLQCSYLRGEARVLLTVSSKQGTPRSASTSFSFYSAPSVLLCRFDTKGTSILLTFDQVTNRAGMSFTDNDCSRILTASSLAGMGVSPKCVWQSSSDSMAINLGHSATLLPGFPVSFLPGMLRSANGVSGASQVSAVVQVPSVVARPIVTISGKSTIDACSDLDLEAVAASPRPLRFVWTANNAEVAAQLRTVDVSSVSFPYPTNFLEPGKSYVFTVIAYDFLGIASAPSSFELNIVSSALPQVCCLCRVAFHSHYVCYPAAVLAQCHYISGICKVSASSYTDLLLCRSLSHQYHLRSSPTRLS
jgi:hypothetical protein